MIRYLTAVCLLAVTAASCSFGVDSDEATDRLDAQRLDVRDDARALLRALEEVFDADLTTQRGTFRGCRGANVDSFGAFRYLFRGRLDVIDPLTPRPYLDLVEQAAGEAGFDEVERRGDAFGDTLEAHKGTVELRVSEYPTQGAYLVLDLEGECLDTPVDDADMWLRREADKTLEG